MPAREPADLARSATGLGSAAAAAPASSQPLRTRYRLTRPFDLAASLAWLRRGDGDPTMLFHAGVLWWTTLTPDGVGTIALRSTRDEVLAAAWGAGAHALLDRVPALCGAHDEPEGFDPGENVMLREAHHRNPGLRLVAPGALCDAVVGSTLEQKVTGLQAFRSWRLLVRTYGTPAPGPTPRAMVAAPPPAVWRRVPSWAFHRAGVEPSQAAAIVRFAQRADTLVPAVMRAADGDERERLLCAVSGIGPWTAAEVRIRVFGDPDAVSVGDFHLAHHVGHALAGRRTDDAGMLRLLEPWRGQRQRVIRLIAAAGAGEPRRGPRLAPEDHRAR